jgi:uncharacterized 2Fe-2S/4Fe-4S cluster protein (DUF4445 family)
MTVRFELPGGEVRSTPHVAGASLADAARAAGIALDMVCGGRGHCGRCAVELQAPGREGERVWACRTPSAAGMRVRVPSTSLAEAPGQVDDAFVLPEHTLRPPLRRWSVTWPRPALETVTSCAERLGTALAAAGAPVPALGAEVLRELAACAAAPERSAWLSSGRSGTELVRVGPAEARGAWAIAADLGTTTVSVLLLDLEDGRVHGRASAYNAQVRCGADVISRIVHAGTPEGLAGLQRLIVHDTLAPLIAEVCASAGISAGDILRMVVAGNTVMTHLFFGYSPAGIGVLPFEPVTRTPPPVRAAEVGLPIHPRAVVEAVPSISGHVGGDLVADAVVARLLDRPAPAMLVDIGTNGEILLWDGRTLWSAATAAGPAFEGAGLAHGGRAQAGAIEHLAWTGAGFRCEVIGGGEPRSLCGSAAVDVLAEGRRAGWMDPCGRFDLEVLRRAGVLCVVEDGGGRHQACRIARRADGGTVWVSERDVAELIKARAALTAGMNTLLEVAGCTWAEVASLSLAGGFARRVYPAAAVAAGLLPDLPPGRMEVVGNGSLGGACLALLDETTADEFVRIRQAARAVELNLQPGFESAYTDAMLLP